MKRHTWLSLLSLKLEMIGRRVERWLDAHDEKFIFAFCLTIIFLLQVALFLS